ncbi:DUF4041 domain-containing protein [Nocardia sp. NPDC052566]|uniref:DUF4041 domain-containing protein n=1 Tax=Nocardia sp. NPDC052566 TaxID=3364330 RepID=UPI0037C9A70E
MSTTPPNWYPDPQDKGFLRYWNGTDWTGDRIPTSAVDAAGAIRYGVVQAEKVPLFGARAYAKRQSQELADALTENQRLRAQLESIGGLEIAELQRLRDQRAAQVTDQQTLLDSLRIQLESLRAQLISTKEEQMLQEIGIYEYRHPLSDSVNYRDELKHLQGEIKELARRDGGAIEASKTWAVEGSDAAGRKMIREYSMLMLRAYNAEADNLVRSLKPYKLPAALDRLDKIATIIERYGKTMQLRVTPQYHKLRRRELEWTADHLEKVAQQKQGERDERDRLREDRKAHEELARERAKLEKLQQQDREALTALEAAGNKDTADAEDLRARLEDRERKLTTITNQENDIRIGHVYVISNVGAFGEGVVQIGMTRRHDPSDRISELSNSAVPFRYDVHALFYAEDAAGIEAELHRRLSDKRVNGVNQRREFFYATPAEVREHLQALTDQMLEFNELAEAVEYRQSPADPRSTRQQ